MSPARKKTAIVTGANRGLGLECCRQLARQGFQVVLTARDGEAARQACAALQAEGLADVEPHALDVTDAASIAAVAHHVESRHGGVDVLINNAGVLPDDPGVMPLAVSMDTVRQAMEVNVYGAWQMCQAFVPGMRLRDAGCIVNVSSGVAHLTTMSTAGMPAYRLSKVGLNALTRMLAAELEGTRVIVNSVDPGSVRTRMGGAGAQREVADAAASIVWAATLPATATRRHPLVEKIVHRAVALLLGAFSRSGNFLRERRAVNWLLCLHLASQFGDLAPLALAAASV